MVSGLFIAVVTAASVISLNLILLGSLLSSRDSIKWYAIASPSLSSSVARYTSDASSAKSLSSLTIFCLSSGITYIFSKFLGLTAPHKISLLEKLAGIALVFCGRSLMWPTLDFTMYSEPSILEIVFTFVGDSTITKGFDMSLLITLFLSYVQDLRKKVF